MTRLTTSSGAVVGNMAVSGSAVASGEEGEGLNMASSPRPERTAPEPHFKPDPK